MPKPYSQLAHWYDQLKDDNFYRHYSAFIKRIAKQYNVSELRVLDIACGTGRLLAELAPDTVLAAGLDMSVEMLTQAQKRLPNIKLYNQNFQSFEVDEKYNLITCTFDSINYALDIKDITEVFRRVSKYLDNQGIFIFDFNTVHKQVSGKVSKGDVILQDRLYGPFWEIDIETPRGKEQHREKLYTLEEIKSALDKNGMHIKSIHSGFKTEVDKENSYQRLIVVAQKTKR